jgi:hypothetical protein
MMKVVGGTAAIGGLLLTAAAAQAEPLDRESFPNDAVFELHRTSAVFRRCDANRDGALQPAELSCYEDQRTASAESAVSSTLELPANVVMRSTAAGGQSMSAAGAASEQDKRPGGNF